MAEPSPALDSAGDDASAARRVDSRVLPAASYQLPATAYRLPPTTDRTPHTAYCLPPTTYQLLATSEISFTNQGIGETNQVIGLPIRRLVSHIHRHSADWSKPMPNQSGDWSTNQVIGRAHLKPITRLVHHHQTTKEVSHLITARSQPFHRTKIKLVNQIR